MGRFEDYISSHITPQMTLLEKLNEVIKFLKTENQFNVFFSSQKWMDNIIEYNVSDVNTGEYNLEINDVVVFTNGYYSYVRTLGNGKFTLGDLYFFVGEKGETGTGISSMSFNAQRHLIVNYDNGNSVDLGLIKGVSSFSINENQHLIVHYDNGTTEDLGAIFSGNVNINGNFTANSIIENMSGYVFSNLAGATFPWTKIYAGVCKTGNKITFVVFGSLKHTEIDTNTPTLCAFQIPSSIGNKLIPYASNILVRDFINFVKANNYKVDIPYQIRKIDAQNIVIDLYNINSLTIDDTYTFRFEVTFLLSDTL